MLSLSPSARAAAFATCTGSRRGRKSARDGPSTTCSASRSIESSHDIRSLQPLRQHFTECKRRILTVGQAQPCRGLCALKLPAQIRRVLAKADQLLVEDLSTEQLGALTPPVEPAGASLGSVFYNHLRAFDANPEQPPRITP